jgi:AraC-like DNA-binding protein
MVRVYDRFWTPAEVAGDREAIASLNGETTLFRMSIASAEQAEHAGPLSLKTVCRGRSVYSFGRQNLSLVPGQMLLVPPRVRYRTRVGIEGADIVTLYFPRCLVRDAVAMFDLAFERILEGATGDPDLLEGFAPHRRLADRHATAILGALAKTRGGPRLTDLAMAALETTVRLGLEAMRSTARIPAARKSVRRELFRRAALARDFIEDHGGREVCLAALAEVACLSPFHLHRVFTASFAETPADMARRRRVEKAQALLAASAQPIAAVGRAVGFESQSAFSRTFRALTGISPSAFRRRFAA